MTAIYMDLTQHAVFDTADSQSLQRTGIRQLLAGIADAALGPLALPQSAFSYLDSHGSLDIEHMQTYKRLMDRLDDPADQAAVIHASKVVYHLYSEMFRGLPRVGERAHAPA